jgi:hypothetical protein
MKFTCYIIIWRLCIIRLTYIFPITHSIDDVMVTVLASSFSLVFLFSLFVFCSRIFSILMFLYIVILCIFNSMLLYTYYIISIFVFDCSINSDGYGSFSHRHLPHISFYFYQRATGPKYGSGVPCLSLKKSLGVGQTHIKICLN